MPPPEQQAFVIQLICSEESISIVLGFNVPFAYEYGFHTGPTVQYTAAPSPGKHNTAFPYLGSHDTARSSPIKVLLCCSSPVGGASMLFFTVQSAEPRFTVDNSTQSSQSCQRPLKSIHTYRACYPQEALSALSEGVSRQCQHMSLSQYHICRLPAAYPCLLYVYE